MKKLISLVSVLVFSAFTTANAIGVNIGVSATAGIFKAEGSETEDRTKSVTDSATAAGGYGSVFLEKTLGSRFTVGIDYVPMALESESADTQKVETTVGTSNTASTVQQKVQVDLEDYTTFYAMLNVTENFYLKAGWSKVDVITNETLGTGAAYGNASLDGETFGFGYNKVFNNSGFIRAEAAYAVFDGVTLTSTTANITAGQTDNIVQLHNLIGATAKISIGKSF